MKFARKIIFMYLIFIISCSNIPFHHSAIHNDGNVVNVTEYKRSGNLVFDSLSVAPIFHDSYLDRMETWNHTAVKWISGKMWPEEETSEETIVTVVVELNAGSTDSHTSRNRKRGGTLFAGNRPKIVRLPNPLTIFAVSVANPRTC